MRVLLIGYGIMSLIALSLAALSGCATQPQPIPHMVAPDEINLA